MPAVPRGQEVRRRAARLRERPVQGGRDVRHAPAHGVALVVAERGAYSWAVDESEREPDRWTVVFTNNIAFAITDASVSTHR